MRADMRGLVVDANKNIYLVVSNSNTMGIEKWDFQTHKTKIFVGQNLGTNSKIYGYENGTGTAAKFYDPVMIVIDSKQNFYVTDTVNRAIRKITPDGIVSTFAGNTKKTDTTPPPPLKDLTGYMDGDVKVAKFSTTNRITIDKNDNIYVADDGNSVVRKITPGGIVSTLAGIPSKTPNSNGCGSFRTSII